MKENLIKYFERVGLNLNDKELIFLNDAHIILPIKFTNEKNISIVKISIENFLPIKLLKKIESKMRSNKNIPSKLILEIRNQKINNLLIWEYLDFIRTDKAMQNSGPIKLLEEKNVKYIEKNNEIIIRTFNELEKQLIEEHQIYYSRKLIRYGFKDINIKVIIQENNQKEILEETNRQYIKENNISKTPSINEIKSKSEYVRKNNKNNKNNKDKTGEFNGFVKTYGLEKQTYESLKDIEENVQNIVVHGFIFKINPVVSKKTGKKNYVIFLSDETSSIKCMYFTKDFGITKFDEINDDIRELPNFEAIKDDFIKVGDWVAIKGNYNYSTYDNDYNFIINNYKKIDKVISKRNDLSEIKRVELHTHSKMSTLDGVSSISDYLKTVDSWNWNSIALTDHLNVQAFPEAISTLKTINSKRKENPLKLIYGSELSMINEEIWYVKNPNNNKLKEAKFVVFDLETTGLSPEFDEIIEFGANVYDYKNGTSVKHDLLIKPKSKLKKFTTELTGITPEMLENKPSIEQVANEIYEIIKDGILVAHNANFDFNFLNTLFIKLGFQPLKNTVIDTLSLARVLKPNLKNHRLGTVAKAYGIIYDEKIAHRADYDAEVLTNLYERMWAYTKKTSTIEVDFDWNQFAPEKMTDNANFRRIRGIHVNIIVKNQKGLKELYKLISKSHIDEFMGSPKIFKNNLINIRKNNNILLGSGCINGWVFENARTGTIEMLRESIKFFDYIEIQPLSVYQHLIDTGDLSLDELKNIIKLIIFESKEQNKIIVATSDAHYVDPKLKQIREIYIHTKGLGGVTHPLFDYKQRIKNYPDQHLRTTQEMLDEFSWLDDEKLINDIVITNTNLISDMIDFNVQPLKSGNFPPAIDKADEFLRDECYKTAKELYGENLPDIVKDRLEKELNSIIKHGFSVVYWISHLLVKKSMDDGYLVGSRGSVGSSFVATSSRITEVNPLKAHYRCAKCKYSDFNVQKEFNCGFDLPNKNCPNCKSKLIGDGHDIPFETFLGFDGDKVPDIDLNFSGEYQPIAHNFTKEMFGENNVFRAGTISTIADKTAFGHTKNYFEMKNSIDSKVTNAEIERLAYLAVNVKKTTGQHPGGIIILPKEYEIEDFTPVNFPADDASSNWLTTHFDFNSIHDNLLKMDILGHVDPTALKMLKDLTGIDPISIPTNDEKVYSLFSNLSELKELQPDLLEGETTGAIGLPEFGTPFVRKMLRDTKPKNFADLVQISGLSHGTDVYVGNAEDLIKNGTATISTVIGCRDDIMVYLMSKGIESSLAFLIMESVRKGKGLKNDWKNIMKKNNIPEWYINSCLKIKYMFPKAHATAYVLMAYRVAWYKIYYPVEYYATWFSTRTDFFDIEVVLNPVDFIRNKMRDIKNRTERKEPVSPKENQLFSVYEVLLEMSCRNIKLKNIDFLISDSHKFKIVLNENGEKEIYPPFSALDSLGETVAQSIINARDNRNFNSVKDLCARTQINKTHLELFKKYKIIDSLKDDEQLIFEF